MQTSSPSPSNSIQSHVFVLRMWREDLGNRCSEWRASARHVSSGEMRYFRDWQDLHEFLEQFTVLPGEMTTNILD